MYKAKVMPLMDMRYLNLIKQHIKERQNRSETIERKYNIRKQMKIKSSTYFKKADYCNPNNQTPSQSNEKANFRIAYGK